MIQINMNLIINFHAGMFDAVAASSRSSNVFKRMSNSFLKFHASHMSTDRYRSTQKAYYYLFVYACARKTARG